MPQLFFHTIAMLAVFGALISAAPLTITTTSLSARADFFSGTTSFFRRADCTNPCVENGSCLGGTTNKGDLDPNNSYGIWHSSEGISGCWNVPANAKSLLLTESSGHGFKGSSLTCAEIKKAVDTNIWDGARPFQMIFGKDTTGNSRCNFLEEGMKSVSYNW